MCILGDLNRTRYVLTPCSQNVAQITHVVTGVVVVLL